MRRISVAFPPFSRSGKSRSTVMFAGIGLALTVLAGCGVSEAEHRKVVQARDSLANELDQIKNGPARLLAAADRALQSEDFDKAKQVSEELLRSHPEASEAQQVEVILQSAERGIAMRDEAARQQREAAEQAREDSARARAQRLTQALSHMRRSYDPVREIAWYYDRTVPRTVNSGKKVLLYIAKPKGGAPYMRFSIRYTADDWLFIQSYIVKADDQTFTIDVSGLSDVERDNGYGGIWEWYDTSADDRELGIVRAIIRAKHVTLRYNGRQYYRDRIISAEEKSALQRVLDAYDALQKESE